MILYWFNFSLAEQNTVMVLMCNGRSRLGSNRNVYAGGLEIEFLK